MALCRPTAARCEARDDSLPLASGEAAPTFSSCEAKMSGLALNRAKAKARLSSRLKPKRRLARHKQSTKLI